MRSNFDADHLAELRRLYRRTTPAERLRGAIRASRFTVRLRASTVRAESRE